MKGEILPIFPFALPTFRSAARGAIFGGRKKQYLLVKLVNCF